MTGFVISAGMPSQAMDGNLTRTEVGRISAAHPAMSPDSADALRLSALPRMGRVLPEE